MKIIFHIDEKQKWEQVLGNLAHMVEARQKFYPDLAIALVATGNAVLPLVKGEANYRLLQSHLEKLAQAGVELNACHQSLKKFGIETELLVSEFQVVPYGVIALVEYQDKGYRYIKP